MLANTIIIEIINIFYVYLFYKLFDLNVSTITFSMLHALMSGILIAQQYYILKKYKTITLGSLMLYVISMYFQFSIIKYCRVGVFYGFTVDNRIRFKGTLIVFLVLFFINLYRIVKQDASVVINQGRDYDLSGSRIWSWIICFIIFIYFFFVYRYDNSVYFSSDYRAQSIMVTIIIYVILCISVYLAGAYWKKDRFVTFIPIMIELISVMFYSLKSGSRALFFTYSLLVVYMIIKKGFLGIAMMTILLIISPWIMIAFSYAAFAISGRYSSGLWQVVAMNLAYRFDLTDLAINIIEKSSWFRHDNSEIVAGFMNCIPSFISTEYKGFAAYRNMLSSVGLIDTVDYSDTFFSMGASAWGIIGVIFIVPVFFWIYERIEKIIDGLNKNSEIVKLICILNLARIEIEWTSFIPELRNMIIEIVIVIFCGKMLDYKYKWGGKNL